MFGSRNSKLGAPGAIAARRLGPDRLVPYVTSLHVRSKIRRQLPQPAYILPSMCAQHITNGFSNLFAFQPSHMFAAKSPTAFPHVCVPSFTHVRSKFADGFPNLFVDDAIDVRNKHVAFLASFHEPSVIFEQISIIYALPRLFVSSFTLVLPFFPTGTMERVRGPRGVGFILWRAGVVFLPHTHHGRRVSGCRDHQDRHVHFLRGSQKGSH